MRDLETPSSTGPKQELFLFFSFSSFRPLLVSLKGRQKWGGNSRRRHGSNQVHLNEQTLLRRGNRRFKSDAAPMTSYWFAFHPPSPYFHFVGGKTFIFLSSSSFVTRKKKGTSAACLPFTLSIKDKDSMRGACYCPERPSNLLKSKVVRQENSLFHVTASLYTQNFILFLFFSFLTLPLWATLVYARVVVVRVGDKTCF